MKRKKEKARLPDSDESLDRGDSSAGHILENRRYWDGMAHEWIEAGERSWKQEEPTWGIWGIPESKLHFLPDDMAGMNAIELGCGTGYVSSWMTRRGASVIGIDNSEKQLETARRLAAEFAFDITWVHGNAEKVPYPDEQFDIAVSEYGAAIWCDPLVWIPEAHRLLKPGGRLTFLGYHPLATVCTPQSGDNSDEILHRPYFSLHRTDWRNVDIDPGGIEFNLPISRWFGLFRDTGFAVLNYQEIEAPESATGDQFSIPAEWAKQWPSEQVWHLEKVRTG